MQSENNHAAKGNLCGVITVFFTLCATVFLGLFFALTESVRVQGARAAAANNTDMGNYSLFSEYEKQLLTDYELFGIDGAYGSGSFQKEQINEHLKMFIDWNENPNSDGLAGFCFDPWQVRLTDSNIEEFALLTDQGGCSFYQQAVSFMKETAVTGMAGKLYRYYTDAQKMDELGQEYEKAKAQSDEDMESVESGAAQLLEKAKKNGIRLERPKNIVNPLKEIIGVVRRGVFKNVIGSANVSEASVSGFDLASHRLRKKGTLKIPEKNGGLSDDLYFREYLLEHFPNYRDKDSGAGSKTIAYQIEYLIIGKKNDLQNLKGVANRLMALREGVNYLYCLQDAEMSAAAETLAFLLMGWTGLVPLVEATKQALLLAWAYGESLIDVRTLFDGGRVPLMKSESTWYLSLDQLANLASILEEGGKDRGSGMYYRDYLRILLNMQGISEQEKRGLDLIELNLRYGGGLANFRVDHCVVAVKDETEWEIPPLFFRVTGAFTGVFGQVWNTTVSAGFAYQ